MLPMAPPGKEYLQHLAYDMDMTKPRISLERAMISMKREIRQIK